MKRLRIIGTGLLALALGGCTSSWYRQQADEESYGLIAEKAPQVSGVPADVSIERGEGPDLSAYPVNTVVFDFLEDYAAREVNAHIVSLDDALELAFNYNRDLQLQKERLYLQALSLTLDRYEYTPIFSSGADGTYVWDAQSEFVQAADGLTQIPTGDIVVRESVNAGPAFRSDMLLRTGGRIALNLTSNFTRFLTGDVSESADTSLIGSFTQPLLRGVGSGVATETLLQAERDLLYQLRDFTRYRKSFAVRVASQYYTVLLNRDTVRNNYQGLDAVLRSLEREQAFQAEGLRTPGQVGRLEQSALQRDLSWTRALTRYNNSLDDFKIMLGLDADASIILDDTELERVAQAGLRAPDLSLDESITVALGSRLDLYTEMDRIQDRARRITVASDAFQPTLDLVLNASVPSEPGGNMGDLDFRRTDFRAGLDLVLPVDRKRERNNYRRTLIEYEAAVRSYEATVDQIKLQVLDAWRNLEEAEKNFEINQTSVEINERRVEEAELRAELGLGNIQDTVDAQNDLTNARTALTGAIVDHNIARLELWRDIGLLYVDSEGQWQEGVDEP